MAMLTVDGVGGGAAVDGSASRQAAWCLANFSAHTGSCLALPSTSSMRHLPASPNQLERRLAVSSVDSSTDADIDLSRAALRPACMAASIEETSWSFQSMELREEGWWRWDLSGSNSGFVGKIWLEF
jgi:hypothetical protein